ncbi:MAG: B12-binding domain-containing radical SAM protein [Magnetococcus sp. YQC-5]
MITMNCNALLISLQDNLSIIGLKYIHNSLRLEINSHLLYMPFCAEEKMEAFRRFVEELSPLFVGISLMSIEFERALFLGRYLKRYFPSLPILSGGIHATIDPESCLAFSDYVCIGEGEGVIRQFARTLIQGGDVRLLDSISYRTHDGHWIKNPLASPQTNLDELPHLEHCPTKSFIQKADGAIVSLENREYSRLARYRGAMFETIISRGCAFSCTYCCNSALVSITGQSKIRKRSVNNVIDELTLAIHKNEDIKIVHFQDDSILSCGATYLDEFCRRYKEEVGLPFIIHTIPVYVSDRIIKTLKDAGVQWINMGLQSGSDRVLKEVFGRKSYRHHFIKAAGLIQSNGLAGKYDIILDNPMESDEEKLETIETILATPRPSLFDFFSLTYYKGTDIYARIQKEMPWILEEDDMSRDFGYYKLTVLNRLTVMAPYLPVSLATWIVAAYRKDANGWPFMSLFFMARWTNLFLFRPIMLLRVLMLAHNDSLPQMCRGIWIYLLEGVKTYIFSKTLKV